MVLPKIKRHLNAKNTLSDHGSIHGHRNLNYTEPSAITRHWNFNAPKICKNTVALPGQMGTLLRLGLRWWHGPWLMGESWVAETRPQMVTRTLTHGRVTSRWNSLISVDFTCCVRSIHHTVNYRYNVIRYNVIHGYYVILSVVPPSSI